MKRAILLHYHEINLKGNNRGWFENRLHQHISKLLGNLDHQGIHRFGARMCIRFKSDVELAEATRRLKWVFGIANFASAWEFPAEMGGIQNGIAELLSGKEFGSFRINARRGTKEFPLNSQQINQLLGSFVQEFSGAAVRLENPELTIYVELVGKRAFVYFDKVPGAGGLPSGTGGKVLCLLSGGLDSPVAAYRLMRRGCQVLFIHFHSFPYTTTESQDKVRRLLEVLARYQLHARLFLVPFADIQKEIVAFAPPSLRVILYRRFMMRIAENLAHREKALALVTGDSLGQVASQTLENMRTVSDAVRLPIFRPLVGEDKEDIMNMGREIETYEISIQPDQDCCTMFIPRHPETMAGIDVVEKAEAALDIPRLVESTMTAVSSELIEPDFSTASRKPVTGHSAVSETFEL